MLVAATALAATRCYRPSPAESCKVTCNAAAHEACPDDMSCGADNLCHAPGDTCGGAMPDALSSDAPSRDGSASSVCFGSNGYVRVCFNSVPSGDVPLTGSINTSNPTGCLVATNTVDQQEVCVVAASTIEVPSGTVSASGSRPLVLVATSTISVGDNTELSVASTGGEHGPGANLGCTMSLLQAGGGGPGGSHGGNHGGSGGPPYSGSYVASIPGGSGFAGGCDGTAGDSGGAGGFGGGAVFLIASQKIGVFGTIDASGTGGHGGPNGSATNGAGGGGGGAGGLIGLDAPMIEMSGTTKLLALGGGGGGGACAGTSASPGLSPTTTSCNPAAGGAGNTGGATAGGAGGSGAGNMPPGAGQPPTAQACGGGGGGGGRGVIVLSQSMTGTGLTCGSVITL